LGGAKKKEVTWGIKVEVAVVEVVAGSAARRARCTKRLAGIARKNVKFLLSQETTVRYTARTVFQSERTKAVKQEL